MQTNSNDKLGATTVTSGSNTSSSISKSRNTLKFKVLEKYKNDLCNNRVKFSDISQRLITLGYYSREDCFEICSLPVAQQMTKVLEKFIEVLKQESEHDDHWNIFIKSLKAEHPLIACKMDSELQKLGKNSETARRLTKDDIGLPLNFIHVQHMGKRKPRRFLSWRSSSVSSSGSNTPSNYSIDEHDPIVKAFFAQAGVTDQHLKKPNTRRVIFDFIEQSGGLEAIRRDVEQMNASGTTPVSSGNIGSDGIVDVSLSENSGTYITKAYGKQSTIPAEKVVSPSKIF